MAVCRWCKADMSPYYIEIHEDKCYEDKGSIEMSRTPDDWDEVRNKLLSVRTSLHTSMDELDTIESYRFTEIDKPLEDILVYYAAVVDLLNQAIGTCTFSDDA